MWLTDLKGVTIITDERGTINGTLQFTHDWNVDDSICDVQCKWLGGPYAHLPLHIVVNLSNFIERNDHEFTIGSSVKVHAAIVGYSPNAGAFIVRRIDA